MMPRFVRQNSDGGAEEVLVDQAAADLFEAARQGSSRSRTVVRPG